MSHRRVPREMTPPPERERTLFESKSLGCDSMKEGALEQVVEDFQQAQGYFNRNVAAGTVHTTW